MGDKIIQIVVEKSQTHMMYAGGGDAGELTHEGLLEEFGEGRLFVSNIHPSTIQALHKQIADYRSALEGDNEVIRDLANSLKHAITHIDRWEPEVREIEVITKHEARIKIAENTQQTLDKHKET